MKNAFSDHDSNAENALTNTPINAPLLPREIIPAASDFASDFANDEANALAQIAEPTNARSFALPLCLGLLALLGAVSLGAWSARRSSQPPVIGPIANRVIVVKPVIVHVAGAVKKPGVYALKSGARVFDALQKAGGATSQADTDALNLAALAEDGAKIEVPNKPQVLAKAAQKPVVVEDLNISIEKADDVTTEVGATKASEVVAELPFASEAAAARLPVKPNAKTATSSTRSLKSAPPNREKTAAKKPRAKKEKSKTIAGLPRALTPSGELSNNASPEFLKKNPLDLNRITAEQLEALPGVGPSLAARVLDYRKQNGGFKSVDELDSVKGIGEKKLEDLRLLLRVENEKAASVVAPAKSSTGESKP